MPQMAPMNWLILYLLFTMIFLLFNFLNYYMFLIKNKNYFLKNYMNKTLEWKW
uniref:ATP synthase F0 subunit 8 n=1 Tax=Nipponoharpalus discrepans TaxID=3070804 RepID=UPI00218244DB|nr:ATP synthase F0 subunit 8 [Nipponoharpalus discrepans]UVG42124.1 ATP synthase F0 subunit 8 [Nipponoharpalus discrepans]